MALVSLACRTYSEFIFFNLETTRNTIWFSPYLLIANDGSIWVFHSSLGKKEIDFDIDLSYLFYRKILTRSNRVDEG